MSYSYKDVSSGEAFRALMESLGWKKLTKRRPVFIKKFSNDLVFRASFLYATFNHVPGNFGGIPAFQVNSENWKKIAKKIGLHFDDGIVYFIVPENPDYRNFVDMTSKMSYLVSFDEINAEAFVKFDECVNSFMEKFKVSECVNFSIKEIEDYRLDVILPGVLGYLSINNEGPLVLDFYKKIKDCMDFDNKIVENDWNRVVEHFLIE